MFTPGFIFTKNKIGGLFIKSRQGFWLKINSLPIYKPTQITGNYGRYIYSLSDTLPNQQLLGISEQYILSFSRYHLFTNRQHHGLTSFNESQGICLNFFNLSNLSPSLLHPITRSSSDHSLPHSSNIYSLKQTTAVQKNTNIPIHRPLLKTLGNLFSISTSSQVLLHKDRVLYNNIVFDEIIVARQLFGSELWLRFQTQSLISKQSMIGSRSRSGFVSAIAFHCLSNQMPQFSSGYGVKSSGLNLPKLSFSLPTSVNSTLISLAQFPVLFVSISRISSPSSSCSNPLSLAIQNAITHLENITQNYLTSLSVNIGLTVDSNLQNISLITKNITENSIVTLTNIQPLYQEIRKEKEIGYSLSNSLIKQISNNQELPSQLNDFRLVCQNGSIGQYSAQEETTIGQVSSCLTLTQNSLINLLTKANGYVSRIVFLPHLLGDSANSLTQDIKYLDQFSLEDHQGNYTRILRETNEPINILLTSFTLLHFATTQSISFSYGVNLVFRSSKNSPLVELHGLVRFTQFKIETKLNKLLAVSNAIKVNSQHPLECYTENNANVSKPIEFSLTKITAHQSMITQAETATWDGLTEILWDNLNTNWESLL